MRKKSRDLFIVRCVEDMNMKVLIRDEEIKERQRDYFDRLCNNSFIQDLSNLVIQFENITIILSTKLNNMK